MTITALEKNACLYWPADLAKKAAEISALGPLLETQDIFLSVLKTADKSPTTWMDVVRASSKLSPNLFLKHLMVLSDIGGERLQRFGRDFSILFPDEKFNFLWNGEEFVYSFSASKTRAWTNKNINVEKSVLLTPVPDFTGTMKDICMILMWGSAIIGNDKLPVEMLEKCIIGTMLGNPTELDTFVKQRYIAVSRITGGSTANDLGHICEEYITNLITKALPAHIKLGGHQIEAVTHNDKNLITFDLVARNSVSHKCVGIEVSFQVTTNSTIERKASLARSRKDLMHAKGHKIAYVIDGSGNFQRSNAIKTIIDNSDCTVNFSDEGLGVLVDFIKKGTE